MKLAPKNATFARKFRRFESKQNAINAARTAQIQEKAAEQINAARTAEIQKKAAEQMPGLLDSQKNRPPPEMPLFGKPPEISPEERATQLNDLKSKIEANKFAPKPAPTPAPRSALPQPVPRSAVPQPVSKPLSMPMERVEIDKQKAQANALPQANFMPMAPTPGNAPAMKRGGSVRNKPATKFSSGGSTSKASSRGDGIAQRGKTKGRYI